jgi:flagellar biosynthesis GTPase FlhF
MSKPLQFIIEKDGKLMLNEEVMTLIKYAVEPRFILFYGKTRLGKSTTLNQLIRGNKETWKYHNKSPFNSCDSLQSVTKGCDIFGPIKITELMKRHNLKTSKIKNDFDVFFCDTEGISSLDGIQKSSISGILTLLQICTISVFMVNKTCSTHDVKEICSQISLTS